MDLSYPSYRVVPVVRRRRATLISPNAHFRPAPHRDARRGHRDAVRIASTKTCDSLESALGVRLKTSGHDVVVEGAPDDVAARRAGARAARRSAARRLPVRAGRRQDGGAAGHVADPTVELQDYFLKGAPRRSAAGRSRPRASRSGATSTRSISATSCLASARRAPARPISRWRRPCAYLLAKRVTRIILARPAVEAGREARLPAGRSAGEGQSVPAPALRRALRHARCRARRAAARARRDRGRADRVHARADAQRRVRDSRRSAEHHLRADEDVPHAPRVSDRRPSSPATSRRSICRPAACRGWSRR